MLDTNLVARINPGNGVFRHFRNRNSRSKRDLRPVLKLGIYMPPTNRVPDTIPSVSAVVQSMSYGLAGQLERVITTTSNGSKETRTGTAYWLVGKCLLCVGSSFRKKSGVHEPDRFARCQARIALNSIKAFGSRISSTQHARRLGIHQIRSPLRTQLICLSMKSRLSFRLS